MKKRAFEVKTGDVLTLANGDTAQVNSVDRTQLDFGKHDLMIYLDGFPPVLLDMWAELEVV